MCMCALGFAWGELILEPDRPSLSVPVSENASLECCYKSQSGRVNVHWIHYYNKTQQLLFDKTAESQKDSKSEKIYCAQLNFPEVKLKDLGFYHCLLNDSGNTYYTHGTYLRVYSECVCKTINLRETTKNKILIAEGFLLLLCVMLPSAILLFKVVPLHDFLFHFLKNQGLNLDDCCATYDQIERSQAQGPYQDVGNIKEEEEEIQLEKP
uniref:CD79a molecule n=1 Tax=Pundamilia nyererei TaxID=303518 RepID=A0A3B4GBD7_9CICH